MPRATEVQRFEQDVGSAIAKRVLELVDHQPIAVDTQPLRRLDLTGDGEEVLEKAMNSVRSPEAHGLPGYIGNR